MPIKRTSSVLKEMAHKTYKMSLEFNEIEDETMALSVILSLLENYINEHDDIDVESFIAMFLTGAKVFADMHGFFDDDEDKEKEAN